MLSSLLSRALPLACLCAAPLAAQSQFQTLPAGFDTVAGNSGTNEPFRTAERQRHHFVYDAGELAATGPIRILSVAFRPASNVTSWSSTTWRDLSLALATSQSDYAAQNYRRHFDDNFATVPKLFFSGDHTLPGGSATGTAPRPWVLAFSSSAGYVYHPGLGRDLILEIRTPGAGGEPNPLGLVIDLQSAARLTLGGNDYFDRTNPLSPLATLYPTNADVAPIARLEYEAFVGVHADFGATRSRGFGPLSVQFTERSFSTNPGALSFSWDFQDDGIADSSSPAPSFTYAAPGSYTVRLRVRDATGARAERVATALVEVLASATSNTSSAEILEFHFDELRGQRCFNAARTSLAPRFGTLPVPNWQGAPGRVGFQTNEPGFGCLAADPVAPFEHVLDTQWPVELCGQWTLAWWQRRVAPLGPAERTVCRFGALPRIVTGGAHGDAFVFEGPFLPSIGSGSGAESPLGVWTHVALVVDDLAGSAEWRINGVPRATQSFTPGALRMRDVASLTFGGGRGSDLPFTSAYDLDDLRLYARALAVPPWNPLLEWSTQHASNSLYDAGCSSSGPIPSIDGNSAPTLGNAAYAITLDGLPPNSSASLVVGFSSHVFGLFPLDLSALLGPGCALSPYPDFSFPVAAPAGSATFASPIPADPLMLGAHAYAQWLSAGPNLALSPGLDLFLR